MPIFRLTLDCGRDVWATDIYLCDTYEGGLAIGRHSKERVDRKISLLTKTALQLHLSPPHPILPADLGKQSWCLPFYTVMIWLVSEPAHDEFRHGSHLAVILFQNEAYPPFTSENEAAVKALNWNGLATDFDY